VVRRTTVAALVAAASLFVGCTAAPPSAPDTAGATVDVHEDALILVDRDSTERVLATLDPARDGRLVDAQLRPGGRVPTTVLALTRQDDDLGARYELRYLVTDGTTTSPLYWFPWRLQVEESLVEVADIPPTPVWSPDGTTVAWVEWDRGGSRLRTVTWRDEDGASNPSDVAVAYQLDGVPPGTQLAGWDVGRDGTPVLHGRDGDTVWRIRLDLDGRVAVAMPDPGGS
jgi:hypothetical protein